MQFNASRVDIKFEKLQMMTTVHINSMSNYQMKCPMHVQLDTFVRMVSVRRSLSTATAQEASPIATDSGGAESGREGLGLRSSGELRTDGADHRQLLTAGSGGHRGSVVGG